MGQTRVDPVACARMIVYRRMVRELRAPRARRPAAGRPGGASVPFPQRPVSTVADARDFWGPRIAGLFAALTLVAALGACVLAVQP